MTADLTIRPVLPAEAAEATALAHRAPHARKTADAAQKFEAFVLQTFIQEMMPESSESVFGSGISGDFWKSMMAEKLAEQVAARGSVGIADYLKSDLAAPVQTSGFNPLDVLSRMSTSNGVGDLLDVKPVSGE